MSISTKKLLPFIVQKVSKMARIVRSVMWLIWRRWCLQSSKFTPLSSTIMPATNESQIESDSDIIQRSASQMVSDNQTMIMSRKKVWVSFSISFRTSFSDFQISKLITSSRRISKLAKAIRLQFYTGLWPFMRIYLHFRMHEVAAGAPGDDIDKKALCRHKNIVFSALHIS